MRHAVVLSEGRSQEILESFLDEHGLTRRVAIYTPHFLSIPSIITRCNLLVTVPHAMGMEFGKPEYGLKAVAPPFLAPRIELRQHWHRKFHKAPRTIWLRQIVAQLFNDESDEWKQAAA